MKPPSKEGLAELDPSSTKATDRRINDILHWVKQRQQHSGIHHTQPIDFAELTQWHFSEKGGNLRHDSRRFFSIEGLRTENSNAPFSAWEQPIIHQPEVGILGLISRVIGGTRQFLVQAKMEPGNINTFQISPTVQATQSNFTRIHAGKPTAYLEYFTESNATPLIDTLQSEHGARFYRKQNRNMIVDVHDDIPLLDGFKWLTLADIHALMHRDNVINMDTRSVISCIDYATHEDYPLLRKASLHTDGELINWLTHIKKDTNISSTLMPLKAIAHWIRDERSIHHETRPLFSVMAVAVTAESREVPQWTQPMLADANPGLLGLIATTINGAPHFLVQAKEEPGNSNGCELYPTVHCSHYLSRTSDPAAPAFLETVLDDHNNSVWFDALLSEEGGRFYQIENRHRIIHIDNAADLAIPAHFQWATYRQLQRLRRFNYLSIGLRTLLVCLPATAEYTA